MAKERPVYTAKLHAAIVDNLRAGAFKKHAAEAAGISVDVFEDWLRLGLAGTEPYVQLALDARQAIAQDAVRNVRVITHAALGKHKGEWKAAAWNLEKKFPLLYGSMPRGHHDEQLEGDATARVFSPWKLPDAGTSVQ
jgi:hypothetical protein